MRLTWSTSSLATAPISCGASAKASRNTTWTRNISSVSGRGRATTSAMANESPRGRWHLHVYRLGRGHRSGTGRCPLSTGGRNARETVEVEQIGQGRTPVRRSTSLRIAAAGATALAAAAITPGWASGSAHFGAPIRVTPANGGGYEPGIYADAEGDLFMTAHKENAELALSPDGRSATATRSMSWAWMSRDGGRHWTNLPLGPADIQNHEFGDEGDMAVDDAHNLYFVDTTVADVTFTAWHISQGKATLKYNTPILGTAETVDDRPWIAAHGNGDVFY